MALTTHFIGLALALSAIGCSSSGGNGGSPNGSSSTSGGGPSRTAISCSDLLNLVAGNALSSDASAGAVASAQHAGDWQTTPSYLQAVPPDGKFCGSVDGPNAEDGGMFSLGAFITTNLWGQALSSFYSPILMSAGCMSTQPDPQSSQITFSCPSNVNGVIGPDTGFEYIGVSVLPP